MKKKKEPRLCKLCQMSIGEKEGYICLTEYNEGNEISTGYYHTKCFRERFMNFQKIQQDAQNLLGMAKPLLQQAKHQGIF